MLSNRRYNKRVSIVSIRPASCGPTGRVNAASDQWMQRHLSQMALHPHRLMKFITPVCVYLEFVLKSKEASKLVSTSFTRTGASRAATQ